MSLRVLVLALVCGAVLAAATPAQAFSPLWSQPVDGAARLVAGDGATVVWAAVSQGTTDILGRAYSADGRALGDGAVALVSGIADLRGWLAAPAPGGDVTLIWKDGGVTSVARRSAAGAKTNGAVAVCADADVAAARGAGATAVPVLAQSDGAGGVYVIMAVSPSASAGDTLLCHVSGTGELAAPSPGVAVSGGTVSAAAADAESHLYVLLAGPGRSGLAMQRYDTGLKADWKDPVSPYNPLLEPPSGAQSPLAVLTHATIGIAVWREGAQIKVQRFTHDGARLWLRPAAADAGAGAEATGDGDGGVYVAWGAADGLHAQHVLGDGSLQDLGDGGHVSVAASSSHVEAVAGDKAGDLAVAYGDGSSGGVAQMTCLGLWTVPELSTAPTPFSALQSDGVDGAYAVGTGADARLWHVAEAGAALTLRARAASVTFGKTVTIGGYFTKDGAPIPGATVTLAARGAGGTTAVTGTDGFYQVAVSPEASATWTATAVAPAGDTVTGVPSQLITVAPSVTLELTHKKTGKYRYTEIFSGEVKPGHAGSTVYVQRQDGATWKTIARATLSGASTYRATWRIPQVTATYSIRVLLPAHADHAEGVSPTARLRMVVKPA